MKTFKQFMKESKVSPQEAKYLDLDSQVQGHIHAGLRMAPTSKRYKKWYPKELTRLQNERDAAKKEWDKVKPPEKSHTEKLIDAANGHPDLSSTKAARNILTKRNIKWQKDNQ